MSKYPHSNTHCDICLLRPSLIKRSHAQSVPTPTFAPKTANIHGVVGFRWFFHDGLERPRGEFSDGEDEREEAGERSRLSCHLDSAVAPPVQRGEGETFCFGHVHNSPKGQKRAFGPNLDRSPDSALRENGTRLSFLLFWFCFNIPGSFLKAPEQYVTAYLLIALLV